jgi:hypothetical protein
MHDIRQVHLVYRGATVSLSQVITQSNVGMHNAAENAGLYVLTLSEIRVCLVAGLRKQGDHA